MRGLKANSLQLIDDPFSWPVSVASGVDPVELKSPQGDGLGPPDAVRQDAFVLRLAGISELRGLRWD